MATVTPTPRWPERIGRLAGWLRWESRRVVQRGLRSRAWRNAVLPLGAGLLLVLAWGLARHHADAAKEAGARWTALANAPALALDTTLSDGHSRMAQFESNLLPHDDLPSQVQDLLNRAAAEHLSAARGEYRPQVDVQGRFLRYRINLPVKGEAAAVRRFIGNALQTHPSLGLESIQFQRPEVGSGDVEARIQWVVLAKLPDVAEGSGR